MKRKADIPLVQFYTKEHCSLCVNAKAVVESVKKSVSFRFEEIDITRDDELFEEFCEQIPVVYINGKKAFKYYVDEQKLLEKLRRCTSE